MVSKGGPARAQLLFALAWLHALVQERRTYIPQGWTKFYEFSLGDLRSGIGVVDLAAKIAKQVLEVCARGFRLGVVCSQAPLCMLERWCSC